MPGKTRLNNSAHRYQIIPEQAGKKGANKKISSIPEIVSVVEIMML
jgi:hypothetical protein